MLKEVLQTPQYQFRSHVLILILMEHAQRGRSPKNRTLRNTKGLNPYFNGTCSKSIDSMKPMFYLRSLNPYFNGTCSKSQRIVHYGIQRLS